MHESQPVPVSVGGRQSVTKQVLFRSSLDSPTEFQFTNQGMYHFSILAWMEDSIEPVSADRFDVVVSQKDADTLAEYLKNNDSMTVRFPQSTWRKWSSRRLTEVEIKALKL
ncbi:MAG: hypothetical protein AAFY56_17885 [Pseudomonadota bacterium]